MRINRKILLLTLLFTILQFKTCGGGLFKRKTTTLRSILKTKPEGQGNGKSVKWADEAEGNKKIPLCKIKYIDPRPKAEEDSEDSEDEEEQEANSPEPKNSLMKMLKSQCGIPTPGRSKGTGEGRGGGKRDEGRKNKCRLPDVTLTGEGGDGCFSWKCPFPLGEKDGRSKGPVTVFGNSGDNRNGKGGFRFPDVEFAPFGSSNNKQSIGHGPGVSKKKWSGCGWKQRLCISKDGENGEKGRGNKNTNSGRESSDRFFLLKEPFRGPKENRHSDSDSNKLRKPIGMGSSCISFRYPCDQPDQGPRGGQYSGSLSSSGYPCQLVGIGSCCMAFRYPWDQSGERSRGGFH